jgi:hypothetical protein
MTEEATAKRSRFSDAPPAPVAAPAPPASSEPAREKAVKKKVYPPTVQYPHVDFVALIKRERSRIQAESGVVIKIGGKVRVPCAHVGR